MAATLSDLPDALILIICKYLNARDIYNFSRTNERFRQVCLDRAVVRNTSFDGQYLLGEDEIKEYIREASHHIHVLNLNHCYWLTSQTVQWIINACKNLRELYVIECRLKVDHLVQLISRLQNLTSLSFSIVSFSDIKKDGFSDAAETLKNLRSLHVYFTSRELSTMEYLGEHTTILDYCTKLEELIISSAGMAIPELYRPIISEPDNHLDLKNMCITNNIHAGAQMMFYGTLSQLPNSKLRWNTLMMPNVNFTEFAKKEEFKDCVQHIELIQNLDVSGSKMNFPNDVLDLGRARMLQHLSVANTFIKSDQLKHIAENCHLLSSINLFGCSQIMLNELNEWDDSGLIAMLQSCKKLRHLNLAGEHHHCQKNGVKVNVHGIFDHIKGLRSLALPACMLCAQQTSRAGSKRSTARMSTGGQCQLAPANRPTPKRRCLQAPSTGMGERVMKISGNMMAPKKCAVAPSTGMERVMKISGNMMAPKKCAVAPSTGMERVMKISGNMIAPKKCAVAPSTGMERVMKISGNMMAPKKCAVPSSSAGGASYSDQPSTSRGSPPPRPPQLLEKININNPDLETLEIIAVNFDSVIHKNKFLNPKNQMFCPCSETRLVTDSIIMPISQMKNLKSLTLCGLPGLSGTYSSSYTLISIAQGCSLLERLSLAHCGAALTGNMFSFALAHFNCLRDLRLEQPHLNLNSVFWDGLGFCGALQRLCVLAREGTYQKEHVADMVAKCTQLAVLQVYAGTTITLAKTLSQMLNKRYGRQRAGFHVSMYRLLADQLPELANAVPAKHFDELTRFMSRVAVQTPDSTTP